MMTIFSGQNIPWDGLNHKAWAFSNYMVVWRKDTGKLGQVGSELRELTWFLGVALKIKYWTSTLHQILFFLYEALIQSFRASTSKRLLSLLKRRLKYKDFLVPGPRLIMLKPPLPQTNKRQQQEHTVSGHIIPVQLALWGQEDRTL